ncbi:MarR family transcriptional regulator [Nocardioides panacisoli]|uniref:MarR family winged helix-turn-helix transcriptional regulator n=1 Tax=Nocardioides panacisoli TaxID=627624 RepID=UPI001C63930E|nr:MarR family transcriptional regulator [Nocardioides panacisoli]QYJ03880.1 MarR family transcriptional regulator [Nocardioides panacisoli]
MSRRDDALQHIEHELGVLLRRARRVVAQRAAEVHPDLQTGAYLMLGHLQRCGALRASALCEVLDLDKAAVSRHVQHLLELGLVDRTPDPEDGRATLIVPSEQGRAQMQQVREQRRRGMDERLADWPTSDLEDLVGLLERYNSALG